MGASYRESHNLLAGEARFRRIFEHSNDAIFLVDPSEDRILDSNNKAERMLGYARDELLAIPMSAIHPHELPELQAFAGAVVERGEGFTDTLCCRAKDGRLVEAEISASTVELDGRTCIIALVRDVSERRRLLRENACLRDEIRAELGAGGLVGASAALGKVREQIAMVAPTDANVLISGESGTGKELVARGLVEASARKEATLIKVNCASIPTELFESEFFGHVRGAFTGAHQARIGRFELADGGTLFLDEVSEIPLFLQGKLLRVLQERQFERVGESRTRKVDVRILAATNRDLLEMCRNGRFRDDLYYRLSVFPIHIPPLRERTQDVAPLLSHYVAQACARHGYPELTVSVAQLRELERYDWPGNVRELQNVVDRAVIVGGGRALEFPPLLSADVRAARSGCPPDELSLSDLKELERQIVERALRESGGKVYGSDGAAARLGLRPTTLASKLKKLGL